ncbi:MAG TPA: PHP domain-containing protein [Kofleriaceae bacterium]|nr:PHP domain-containing protein [Kofleriaceae bacterium]
MEPSLIASQLREIAIYFDLDGDRHRALAYDKAAKSIEAANGLQRLLDEGRLEELPGIGPSIARTVGDLARRGSATVLDNLRAKWPMVIVELAQLPYVGVVKARKIHEALAPHDLDAVAAACRAGALRGIKGFGATSEAKILTAIEERRHVGSRALHMDAEEHALSIAQHLRADPAALRVEIAGPVRRWLEIVDHLAFAVATEQPEAIVERFRSYALITGVEHGEEKISARLADGMKCEVHLAPPARFGWALICATGSPAHVDELRARGADAILGDEAEVYAKLGVPFVPPEVRDGDGELGTDWSDLVAQRDVTTATHCHTTYSDGRHTILEMAEAAAGLGFAAITITDHSAAASYAGGLDADKLRAQHAEIATLAAPIRILKGTEADILADGTIDVPAELLPDLDLVIASVHQRYKLDEDGMTNRLVAAMRQPFFKIWGHALGRLVLRRDPIKVRIDEIFDAISESRAAIEINGDPHRLDLDPVHARAAAERGIPFVLSTDAHSIGNLQYLRWAVAMARRARIRRRQVLNTLPPDELAALIRPVS